MLQEGNLFHPSHKLHVQNYVMKITGDFIPSVATVPDIRLIATFIQPNIIHSLA